MSERGTSETKRVGVIGCLGHEPREQAAILAVLLGVPLHADDVSLARGLERLHQANAARGLLIAGVSIDVVDDTARIAGFARDLGATYPLWLDRDDRVSMIFRSIGVPSTYLIDRGGVLRWRHMGPVRSDDPALLAALETALADTSSR